MKEPEKTEEEKAQHKVFEQWERERIIHRLVTVFEYDIGGIVWANPTLKYFGDAPNYFGEYYLNEDVWNTARDRFLHGENK
jgi:hypothetical protein